MNFSRCRQSWSGLIFYIPVSCIECLADDSCTVASTFVMTLLSPCRVDVSSAVKAFVISPSAMSPSSCIKVSCEDFCNNASMSILFTSMLCRVAVLTFWASDTSVIDSSSASLYSTSSSVGVVTSTSVCVLFLLAIISRCAYDCGGCHLSSASIFWNYLK